MIILVVALIAIIFLVAAKIMYENTGFEIASAISLTCGAVTLVVLIIMIFATIVVKIETPAFEVKNQRRYESLVYQAENNLYENDNDIGKKELVNQIQKWNENLAVGKIMQDNIWVGCFYSHVYDKFDFISLDTIR